MPIHLRDMLVKMKEKDRNGTPIPFDIVFTKLSTGEVATINNAVMTGLRHNMKDHRTIGVINTDSKQVRAIKIRLIKKFNGIDVFW
jgi:hypothetical protein